MTARTDPQTLITALIEARQSGQPLRAADWVSAVRNEAARAMTPETAGDWIDAMAVSLELVASRWAEGLGAPALLRMADHQSHAGLVLGHWQPYAARDWAVQTCRVEIGTEAPMTRTGGHSLNDPVRVLPAWLRHLTRQGTTVVASAVVTTGSWVGCLPVERGDRVSVSVEGLGEVVVSV